jgi:hypothetical protein
MKKLLLLFILFSASTKIYAQLRFNRASVILKDSSIAIDGFVSSIAIRNNYVVDSVHSNFHTDMPDTTTVIPCSSIHVAGPRITVSFCNTNLGSIWAQATITPTDSVQMRKDSISITQRYGLHGWPQPNRRLPKVTQYVRISLNGNPLFDWKPIDSLPETLCKFYREIPVPGSKLPVTEFIYGYIYQFCDTTLKIHDQLFIEVKIEPKNWMIDSYNITRVAASPEIKASFSTPDASGNIGVEETTGPFLEKKTSSAPTSRN